MSSLGLHIRAHRVDGGNGMAHRQAGDLHVTAAATFGTVVIVFESLDKAKAWNDSEEVKKARSIDRGATFRSYIVEGARRVQHDEHAIH